MQGTLAFALPRAHLYAYFGLFDTATAYAVEDKKNLHFLGTWVIGQFCLIFSGLCSYPWDTVRRRMMMQSGRKDVLYKSTMDCWKKLYLNEGGFQAFFKGAGSNVLLGMGSALVLAFYSNKSQFDM